MTNSAHSIDARDLSSRLSRLAQNDTTTINHGSNTDRTTDSGTRGVSRATSLDSLPRFTKSPTMSSTSTTSTRFSGLHSHPSRALHRKDVEVSAGEFSMPRVPKRSRRATDASRESEKTERKRKERNSFEAHAYGRHSNQWLFNDFSFTDAVRRGCGKVFGRDNSE
ncbi:hypothetical protein E8E13_007285 [Curvularia kusanoi]|uniref:Uncharacterized protein n=1 Tax=Curvularia kusanoi TaxID=90978 RepID=A0A9P4TL04_CURKU|nr:hypothetical protein E8E13_007285 [Curvularia kusanoi]